MIVKTIFIVCENPEQLQQLYDNELNKDNVIINLNKEFYLITQQHGILILNG